MNCEAYIAYYQAGEVQLYPNNIDTEFLSDIFASLPDEVGGHADFLAIQRRGDMVYYAFIAPLVGAGKDKVCLMIGLNNILITDILALETFMRHSMRGLANKYRMARYEESLGGYLSPDTDAENFAANIPAAQATLRDRFNERFNGCGTQPGPIDYAHSPQTDLRILLPDSSLQPSSSRSLTRSIESGNTLLVQIPKQDAKHPVEDSPTPKPEDLKCGEDPSPTPVNPNLEPFKYPWWFWLIIPSILGIYFILASIPWDSCSRSSVGFDTICETPEQQILYSGAEGRAGDDRTFHFYKGYFIDNGISYPIMVAFVDSGRQITEAVYKNVNYGGTIKMDYESYGDGIRLQGKDGNNDFTITLHTDGQWLRGTTTDGDKTMSVEMGPTYESFMSKYLD